MERPLVGAWETTMKKTTAKTGEVVRKPCPPMTPERRIYISEVARLAKAVQVLVKAGASRDEIDAATKRLYAIAPVHMGGPPKGQCPIRDAGRDTFNE